MLLFEAPRLGRQLEGGDAGGVVDPEIDVAQGLRGHLELGPVGLGEIAAGDPLLVDPGLGRQESPDELFGGHFEREDRDLLAAAQGGVGADVDPERGLSHRRPGGEDHQVLALEAGGELVDTDKTGVETGQGRVGSRALASMLASSRVGEAADRGSSPPARVSSAILIDVLLGRLSTASRASP